MSNLIFPTLAGLTWDIKPVPTWSTVVQKSKNRARTALLNDPYPLWTFELSYEFLRGPAYPQPQPPASTNNPQGYSELDQIVGFYNQMRGSFDNFLLDLGQLTQRPGESTVRGVQIGTGDGTTTTFYLQREYGGFMDEVQNPVGPVFITVNGVLSPGTGSIPAWTPGANGAINFTAAPALNAVITADFHWRFRCCFAEDSLGLEGFMYQLYELQSLKLEEVKL
jgi:uncharacterized protein (TIGR02217 family)